MSCAQHVGAGASEPLSVGVLVSTYQRPASLKRCLEGIAMQTHRPDDVIVVCWQGDDETRSWLQEREDDGLPVRMVTVMPAGLVASRNAGLSVCRTDVLAIVDDDVVPHADWLRRVREHFIADAALGGVGGRDHIHNGERFDERLAAPVGIVQWFGRVIGNHHLGYGRPREVHLLKGANMSYRARAFASLSFDSRLRGRSTQPHDDLAFSLAVRRRGWKLAYDPAVLVYHFAGRPDERAYSSVAAMVRPDELHDATFNMVVALWNELSPLQRAAFALWSMLIGTGAEPGLLQAVRYTPRLGFASWRRFWVTQCGKMAAYLALLIRP